MSVPIKTQIRITYWAAMIALTVGTVTLGNAIEILGKSLDTSAHARITPKPAVTAPVFTPR